MGRTRTEPDDETFRKSREYYLKRRDIVLARAKKQYAEEREVRLATAAKIRNAARKARLRAKREWTPTYRKRFEAARDLVRSFKEGKPCLDCNQYYPYYVLDFDHVRGHKRASLSDLVQSGPSIKVIMAEIDKCDLVCANCHRERTFRRNNEKI